MIRPDYTIRNAASGSYNMPQTFKILAELMLKEYTLSTFLGNNDDFPDGLLPNPYEVIKAFESELSVLENRYGNSWDAGVQRLFDCAKLKLYSYGLPRKRSNSVPRATNGYPQLSEARIANAQVTYYLSRAYSTAVRLLKSAVSGNSGIVHNQQPSPTSADNTPTDASLYMYYSSFDLYNTVYTIMFLLQITQHWQLNPEREETNNLIRQVWLMLKSRSLADGDHFHRVCEIIEYISGIHWPHNGEAQEAAELGARSRMSGSIMYDLIYRAKQRYKEGRMRHKEQLPDEQAQSTSPSVAPDVTPWPNGMPDGIPPFEDFFWTDWAAVVGTTADPFANFPTPATTF
jgi:hypothetical protein